MIFRYIAYMPAQLLCLDQRVASYQCAMLILTQRSWV
jgi:hypothetical protein